jgi:hypothetical protein
MALNKIRDNSELTKLLSLEEAKKLYQLEDWSYWKIAEKAGMSLLECKNLIEGHYGLKNITRAATTAYKKTRKGKTPERPTSKDLKKRVDKALLDKKGNIVVNVNPETLEISYDVNECVICKDPLVRRVADKLIRAGIASHSIKKELDAKFYELELNIQEGTVETHIKNHCQQDVAMAREIAEYHAQGQIKDLLLNRRSIITFGALTELALNTLFENIANGTTRPSIQDLVALKRLENEVMSNEHSYGKLTEEYQNLLTAIEKVSDRETLDKLRMELGIKALKTKDNYEEAEVVE